MNICCDPSLEPSQRDGSNEGSQPIFNVEIMKDYSRIISAAPSVGSNIAAWLCKI